MENIWLFECEFDNGSGDIKSEQLAFYDLELAKECLREHKEKYKDEIECYGFKSEYSKLTCGDAEIDLKDTYFYGNNTCGSGYLELQVVRVDLKQRYYIDFVDTLNGKKLLKTISTNEDAYYLVCEFLKEETIARVEEKEDFICKGLKFYYATTDNIAKIENKEIKNNAERQQEQIKLVFSMLKVEGYEPKYEETPKYTERKVNM